MTDAAVLSHILRLPHAKANFKQLVKELGAGGPSREELEAILERMVIRGELLELRSGHYQVTARSREYAVGRLQMHRDGFGFLISDKPVEGVKGDVFLPAGTASTAMHGDRVLVKIKRIESDGKADGTIVRILKRAHSTVVGEFRIRRRGNFVAPMDARIQEWILIPDGMEIPASGTTVDRVGVKPLAITNVAQLDGMIVNAEMLSYAENGEGPVGRVIEVLGNPDDFGIDVEVIIRKHHLPHEFPEEALEQARRFPAEVSARDIEGRRDFRHLDIVTIDGETARDFDDAVWVEKLENGSYALQVHIADVSHYVRPGSPIDEEAHLRGTSVYFPDRAVPMLPAELSTELCSLKPHVDRLVLSALMEFDRQGDLRTVEFARGVIRSAERMTYTNVHKLLDGDAEQRERYRNLIPNFELMQEFALVLNRKRVRRGSIDFDLPEPLIEFDEWGAMVGVTRAPRNIAHRLIEEFMLAANEAVAQRLGEYGPAIYRIHETPDAKRVMDFEEVAAQYGYSLGVGAIPVKKFGMVDKGRDGRKKRKEIVVPEREIRISSRDYQKLVAKLDGKPEERILSYLMLRSLRQARYSPDNEGHFALATDHYTHFTSPIRRYPDLIVHRLLKAVLDHGEPADYGELRVIADETSATERRASEAERELVEWKKIRFMESRVGEDFDGMIISAAKFGLFVELADLFVEGLVPIDTLPGDRYTYHENVRKIIGQRSRREFSIGDKVRVLLDRVDGVERKLQFSLLEPETPKRHKR